MDVREDPVTSLDGVTAAGASSAVRASYCRAVAFTIKGNGLTSGATVKVQGANTDSSDDEDWWDLDSSLISADGTTEVIEEFPPPFVRTNITSYTDGTWTTTIAKIGNRGH